MLERFKTLRSKFLFVLLIPVVIATVTVTVLFGIQTFFDLKSDVLAKKEEMAALGAKLLMAPMWNFDKAQVESIASSIAANPDVASVIVRNDQGDIIAQVGEPKLELVVRQDIAQVGRQRVYMLGKMEITFHNERIHAAITKQIIQNSLLLLSLVVVILVSAVFANRRIVDRPLGQLLRAIGQTEERGSHAPVNWHSKDEIGEVITAFNAMQETLGFKDQNLRQSEERFRLLSELSLEGLIINRKGEVLDSNTSIEKMFGYSHEEFKSITPATIIAKESMPLVMEHIQNDLETPYEVIGVRKNGTRFPIEIHARMMELGGEMLRVTCVQDITERKRMTRYHHATVKRLQLLLDLSRDAPMLSEKELLKRSLDIAVTITDSKIGYLHLVNEDQETLTLSTWNDAAMELCTADYDNHYPISQAGVWADAIRFRRPVIHNDYQAIPDKPGYPEGHFHLIRHMSAPVTDSDRISLIVGVGNKESDYDDYDVNLLQAVSNDIEKIVMKRRAELALEERTHELERTKEEAESANRAKSEFLASMSHELRTPLNAVLGFAQMLEFDPRNALSATQKEHVESILEGGNHLLALINEVLDLARIEAQQLDLTLENANANEIVSKCVALTAPIGAPRRINIVDKLSDGPTVHLCADSLRLKQALLNLFSNAIKFNKDGGTVTIDGKPTGDGLFRISVTDTGAGIEDKDYPGVFLMFQRLGANSMVAREGTGIGLTVTKLIVEQMSGQIGFESEVGVGSTFWIELPLGSNEEMSG